MSCVPTPKPPTPALPGISFTPQLPVPQVPLPDACCNITRFKNPIPPLELPPGFVQPGFVNAIRNAMAKFREYESQLVPDCPGE